ncbi:MAG: OmpH family outer membrane protein [Phaeodactylibacter sp.]|uniref:OmpH family outer membrane protein n=1 Tax=Phaeodactylibacter sp. TaxID=1940289 RepID=UPI0032EF0F65
MKSLLKITCLIVLFAAAAGTLQAQKFGYVNSAAILAEMPDVKQADANLEALQKQLQKKGQSMLEQLQQDYTALQKKVQGGDLSPKQQEEEAQKLQAREQEIAKFEQDMRKQVSDKRDELLGPIYEKVNQAIEDVAKENNYQFIFDQNVLLYSEESQNVNELVKAKLAN